MQCHPFHSFQMVDDRCRNKYPPLEYPVNHSKEKSFLGWRCQTTEGETMWGISRHHLDDALRVNNPWLKLIMAHYQVRWWVWTYLKVFPQTLDEVWAWTLLEDWIPLRSHQFEGAISQGYLGNICHGSMVKKPFEMILPNHIKPPD